MNKPLLGATVASCLAVAAVSAAHAQAADDSPPPEDTTETAPSSHVDPEADGRSYSTTAKADENSESTIDDTDADSTVVQLPPIEVRGTVSAREIGRVQLTREDVQRLQDGNGDLNRLLRTLPNVQFDESLSDAYALGEITPKNVSISGGRYYDNRFEIDHLSTNSLLDPGSSASENSIGDTPGYAQSQFFDSELIGSLVVYDSNAPASIGRFTGGVVSARTRNPSAQRRFSAFFSGTDDSMVHFNTVSSALSVSEDGEEASVNGQPQFHKYRYGFSFDQPLGEHSGVLLSATRLESKIPTLTLAQYRSEARDNTNVLLKGHTEVSGFALSASASYTPYTADNLLTNVKASNFTVTGGGYATTLEAQGYTRYGLTTLSLGHSGSENSREAPRDYLVWLTSSNGPDWGEAIYSLNSREGGYGDIDKSQQTTTFSGSLVRPLLGGKLDVGLSLDAVSARYRRRVDSRYYTSGSIDSRIQCVGDDVPACIDGNQALFTRLVYPADTADVALIQGGLYGDWLLEAERWSVRLGLRADADDFQQNLNLAPRSLVTWNPWRELELHLGANRYYSVSLLTYKLREARQPYQVEYREATGATIGGSPVLLVQDDWESTAAAGDKVYSGSVSDLDTPYSDELAGGFSFPLFGGAAGLRGTLRRYHDEFSQYESPEDPNTGLVTLAPANNGSGEYHSLVFAWTRRLWAVDLGFNVTWSETERSNNSYDTRSSDEIANEYVYYQGEVRARGEVGILADDYARPVIANLSLSAQPLPRLQVSLTGQFRDRYENIDDTGNDVRVVIQECDACPAAEAELPVYGTVTRPETLLFDAKLRYTQPLRTHDALEFELIVDNLFDARTHTATRARPYEAGIGAWALVRYTLGAR